ALAGLRVELVDAATDSVFFSISGHINEDNKRDPAHVAFRPVVVDLSGQQGKEIFIRLVDEETGTVPEIAYIGDNHWAHISFDDFKFHEERPTYVHELRPNDV